MSLHAINAKTLGISEYTGLSFIKIFEHNGKTYGLTATQLLELTGSDDDGTDIDGHVLTGIVHGGSPEEKRCSRAYVKDVYANNLTVSTLVEEVDADEEIAQNTYSYDVPSQVGARHHAQTVRLRRDIAAVGWSFKVANTDGGGLALKYLAADIEGIEIDV